MNRHVVAAIRAQNNADGPDRGRRSCNGCKGENRLAARFKQIVARAIRDGLHEWAGLLPPDRSGTD